MKAAISTFVLISAVLAAAELLAQTDLTFVGNQPVFEVGAAGEWDSGDIIDTSVILDGDTLRMWYAGTDTLDNTHFQIGYAWSLDGVSWNRYAGNPISNTDSWLGAPGSPRMHGQ